MGKKIRTAEQKTTLVIWRNIIAAIIIMLLIVARQWIIQDNITKNANISTLMSASLHELLVMDRIENRLLSLVETTEPAERDNVSKLVQSDLREWEEYNRQIDGLFPEYLKFDDDSALAEELKTSSEDRFSTL